MKPDYDKEKFKIDKYGNLIPKEREDEEKENKKEIGCKHQWHQTELFGFKTKYIYRLCGKCGHTQRAKLIFRDYDA